MKHYREAWAWKGTTEGWLEQQLATAPRPHLHVCSGSSALGDVTVDLAHPDAMVRGDARALPVKDRSAGTVLMDPPWRMLMAEKQAFITEAGRVLRPGGLLLLYAPWWPTPLWAELEQAWVRVNGKHQLPFPAVLLSRWRKLEGAR